MVRFSVESVSLLVLNKRQDLIKQHQRKEGTPGGNHGNMESVVTVRLEPSWPKGKGAIGEAPAWTIELVWN